VSTVFPGYSEHAPPVGERGVGVVDGDVALVRQQLRDQRELPVLAMRGVGPVVLADMGMGGRQALPVERRLAGGLQPDENRDLAQNSVNSSRLMPRRVS
jgi:hypothetical protein